MTAFEGARHELNSYVCDPFLPSILTTWTSADDVSARPARPSQAVGCGASRYGCHVIGMP
jgi:hypothetical protein